MQDKDVVRLIEQESFLNYCTSRNDQDVRYWKQWLEEHPEYIQQVETMRQLVLLMAKDARTREIKQNYADLQSRITAGTEIIIPARRLWARIAAAASILVFVTAGSYFIWRPKPVSLVTAIKPGTFKNDVSHGNQAILTLANGKQLSITGIPAGYISNTGIKKSKNGGLIYDQSNSKPDIYNTLTVPYGGGKHELKLSDGTLVLLDAGSSIRFPVAFNGKERRISITGQVYFEVVHNSKKPFLVTVQDQTIEDIGTHFNINAFDGVIRTTLLEGSIKVGQAILRPGQQAVQNASGQFSIMDEVDEESVVAWKNDIFKFNHTNLKAVMQQISRWYNVQVSYEGPEKAYSFGGYLSREANLTSILKILQLNGVKFSLTGQKLIVYR